MLLLSTLYEPLLKQLISVLGTFDAVRHYETRTDQATANRLSVQMELQADCFAGVWGHHTAERGLINRQDIATAMHTAAQIGDDYLQRRARGTVAPETFTHGSSQQRMHWFARGLTSGDMRQCAPVAAQVKGMRLTCLCTGDRTPRGGRCQKTALPFVEILRVPRHPRTTAAQQAGGQAVLPHAPHRLSVCPTGAYHRFRFSGPTAALYLGDSLCRATQEAHGPVQRHGTITARRHGRHQDFRCPEVQ